MISRSEINRTVDFNHHTIDKLEFPRCFNRPEVFSRPHGVENQALSSNLHLNNNNKKNSKK